MSSALTKRDIDVSKVFLAYLSLQGDVNRTAFALRMDVETVRELAVEENWSAKIEQFGALREQDQNVQINVNRALNFVQARQLSGLVDAVIKKLSDPDALNDALTTVTKNGSTFSTKPITDLVRAAEMCQTMTRLALGDTGVNPEGDKASGAVVGLNVARVLNAVASSNGVDAATIVKQSSDLLDADLTRHIGAEATATS